MHGAKEISASLKTYNIPKKKAKKDVQPAVDISKPSVTWKDALPGTAEFKSIEEILSSSEYRERNLRFKLDNVKLIENHFLKHRFETYRQKLKENRQPSGETIAFIQLGFEDAEREYLALNGVAVGSSFNTDLGNPEHGVYLFNKFDLVSPQPLFTESDVVVPDVRSGRIKSQVPLRILICKVLRGRQYTVGLGSTDLDPVPGYGCHVVQRNTMEFPRTALEKYRNNAIYVYEHDDSLGIVEVPSGILPYAVVDVLPFNSKECKSIKEKLDNRNLPVYNPTNPLYVGQFTMLDRQFVLTLVGNANDAAKVLGIDPSLDFYIMQSWEMLSENGEFVTPFQELLTSKCGQLATTRELELSRGGNFVAYFMLQCLERSPEEKRHFAEFCHRVRLERGILCCATFENFRVYCIPSSELTARMGFAWPREPTMHLLMQCKKRSFYFEPGEETMSSVGYSKEAMRRNPTPNDYVKGSDWLLKDMADEAYRLISETTGNKGHNHIWRCINPDKQFPRPADLEKLPEADWDKEPIQAPPPKPQRRPAHPHPPPTPDSDSTPASVQSRQEEDMDIDDENQDSQDSPSSSAHQVDPRRVRSPPPHAPPQHDENPRDPRSFYRGDPRVQPPRPVLLGTPGDPRLPSGVLRDPRRPQHSGADYPPKDPRSNQVRFNDEKLEEVRFITPEQKLANEQKKRMEQAPSSLARPPPPTVPGATPTSVPKSSDAFRNMFSILKSGQMPSSTSEPVSLAAFKLPGSKDANAEEKSVEKPTETTVPGMVPPADGSVPVTTTPSVRRKRVTELPLPVLASKHRDPLDISLDTVEEADKMQIDSGGESDAEPETQEKENEEKAVDKKDEYDPASVEFVDSDEDDDKEVLMVDEEIEDAPSPGASDEFESDAGEHFADQKPNMADIQVPKAPEVPTTVQAASSPSRRPAVDAASLVMRLFNTSVNNSEQAGGVQDTQKKAAMTNVTDFLSKFIGVTKAPSAVLEQADAEPIVRTPKQEPEEDEGPKSPEPEAPASPVPDDVPQSPPQEDNGIGNEVRVIPVDGDEDSDYRFPSTARRSRFDTTGRVPVLQPFGSAEDVDLRVAAPIAKKSSQSTDVEPPIRPSIDEALKKINLAGINQQALNDVKQILARNKKPDDFSIANGVQKTLMESLKKREIQWEPPEPHETARYTQLIMKNLVKGLNLNKGVVHNLKSINVSKESDVLHMSSVPNRILPAGVNKIMPAEVNLATTTMPSDPRAMSANNVWNSMYHPHSQGLQGANVPTTTVQFGHRGLGQAPGSHGYGQAQVPDMFRPGPSISPHSRGLLGDRPGDVPYPNPGTYLHHPAVPTIGTHGYGSTMSSHLLGQQAAAQAMAAQADKTYPSSVTSREDLFEDLSEKDQSEGSQLNRKLRRKLAKGEVLEPAASSFAARPRELPEKLGPSRRDFDERETRTEATKYRSVEDSWTEAIKKKQSPRKESAEKKSERVQDKDEREAGIRGEGELSTEEAVKDLEEGEIEEGEIASSEDEGRASDEKSATQRQEPVEDVDERVAAYDVGPHPFGFGRTPSFTGFSAAQQNRQQQIAASVAQHPAVPQPWSLPGRGRGGFAGQLPWPQPAFGQRPPGHYPGGAPGYPGARAQMGAPRPDIHQPVIDVVTIVVLDHMLFNLISNMKSWILEEILDHMDKMRLNNEAKMFVYVHHHIMELIKQKIRDLAEDSRCPEYRTCLELFKKYEERKIAQVLPVHGCDTAGTRSKEVTLQCLREIREHQTHGSQSRIIYLSKMSPQSEAGSELLGEGFMLMSPEELVSNLHINSRG